METGDTMHRLQTIVEECELQLLRLALREPRYCHQESDLARWAADRRLQTSAARAQLNRGIQRWCHTAVPDAFTSGYCDAGGRRRLPDVSEARGDTERRLTHWAATRVERSVAPVFDRLDALWNAVDDECALAHDITGTLIVDAIDKDLASDSYAGLTTVPGDLGQRRGMVAAAMDCAESTLEWAAAKGKADAAGDVVRFRNQVGAKGSASGGPAVPRDKPQYRPPSAAALLWPLRAASSVSPPVPRASAHPSS